MEKSRSNEFSNRKKALDYQVLFSYSGENKMNDMFELIIAPASQIALICGMAEVLKMAGVPKKYIPICDVLMGIVNSVLLYCCVMDQSMIESIFVGIGLGLSACGLYSGVKNTIE